MTILSNNIVKVTLVDELMTLHLDYVDTCLKGCMLTNAELLKVILISLIYNVTMMLTS